MPWTTRVLVVANRTLGSDQLRRALKARAERGPGPVEFVLLAPATHLGAGATAGRTSAEAQLGAAVERLTAAGLTVMAAVGDPDPIVAVHEAWDPTRFDEVIVSTLPTGASRWLALDLPRRIARITGAPVAHVVSEPERPPAPPPSRPPAHADWTAVLTGRTP